MKEGISHEDESRSSGSRELSARKRKNNKGSGTELDPRLQMEWRPVRSPGPDCQPRKLGLNLASSRGSLQVGD